MCDDQQPGVLRDVWWLLRAQSSGRQSPGGWSQLTVTGPLKPTSRWSLGACLTPALRYLLSCLNSRHARTLNQASCSGVKHCIVSPLLGSWALTLLSPPGHSVLPECGLCPDPWPFAVGPRLSAKEEVLGVWDRTRRTTLGRQTPPRPCGSQKGPPFSIWGILMLQGPNHGTFRGDPSPAQRGSGKGH